VQATKSFFEFNPAINAFFENALNPKIKIASNRVRTRSVVKSSAVDGSARASIAGTGAIQGLAAHQSRARRRASILLALLQGHAVCVLTVPPEAGGARKVVAGNARGAPVIFSWSPRFAKSMQ